VNYLWGQVGWTIASESNLTVGVVFVPVSEFDKKDIRTHICEVRERSRGIVILLYVSLLYLWYS
jgi:hypothetical protein